MSTDVILSLTGSLDAELEKARSTLREVDDGIKKLFGKEKAADIGGSFGGARNRSGRGNQDYGDAHFSDRNRRRRGDDFNDGEPLDKKRRLEGNSTGKGSPMVIGPRVRPRLSSEDEGYRKSGGGGARRLQSRIVSSGKEKSREEVLAEQRSDMKGRDRNKRMFGTLLGTLQRFKQEETKLKEKEDKRAKIEAKLDEAAKKERDEVRTKRLQLIRERKLRITEIKRLEIKRNRLADLTAWEEKTKYLANFIRTEAKPNIFYLPKKLNPIMECRLEQSKQYVTELIASKRKLVLEDLEDYEQRSKRYWERRLDGRETKRADPMDEDIEAELKEIMKSDDLALDDEMMHPGSEEGEPEVGTGGEVVDFKVTVFTSEQNQLKNGSSSLATDDHDDDVRHEEEETNGSPRVKIIRKLSLHGDEVVNCKVEMETSEEVEERRKDDDDDEDDDEDGATSNNNDNDENDNGSRSAQSENEEEEQADNDNL